MKVFNIAVIMSSYNGENYIKEQINSILNQNVNAVIDLYIRDDGSTDNTWEILKKISLEDEHVKITKGKNIGYVASFLSIIKILATNKTFYDFYSLSDQDDVWMDNKLKTAIDILITKDNSIPQLYGCTSLLVDENLNFLGVTQKKKKPITFFNSIIQNFVPGHSQVMNHQMLLLLKDADPTQIYVHDSYITNVALLNGELSFDNEPHTYYRQHSNNELGSSRKFFNWLINHIKRIKRGDSKRYSKQILYIFNKYGELMDKEQQKELSLFFDCQKNYVTRLKYILHTKLYRQDFIDNIMFKMLYIIGGYKL